MHENRETSGTPRSDQDRGRSEKAHSHNSDMHVSEESDCAIVPMNQPNNEDSIFSGGWGGKGADQGEHRSVQHEPDTERGTRVPGIERCTKSSEGQEARTYLASLSDAMLSRYSSKVGAVGVNAHVRICAGGVE